MVETQLPSYIATVQPLKPSSLRVASDGLRSHKSVPVWAIWPGNCHRWQRPLLSETGPLTEEEGTGVMVALKISMCQRISACGGPEMVKKQVFVVSVSRVTWFSMSWCNVWSSGRSALPARGKDAAVLVGWWQRTCLQCTVIPPHRIPSLCLCTSYTIPAGSSLAHW